MTFAQRRNRPRRISQNVSPLSDAWLYLDNTAYKTTANPHPVRKLLLATRPFFRPALLGRIDAQRLNRRQFLTLRQKIKPLCSACVEILLILWRWTGFPITFLKTLSLLDTVIFELQICVIIGFCHEVDKNCRYLMQIIKKYMNLYTPFSGLFWWFNIMGGSMRTIHQNTEALAVASKQIGLEVNADNT